MSDKIEWLQDGPFSCYVWLRGGAVRLVVWKETGLYRWSYERYKRTGSMEMIPASGTAQSMEEAETMAEKAYRQLSRRNL